MLYLYISHTKYHIWCSVLCVLVYMEVILEPNIVSDFTKAFLDDPQWHEHIKDPQLEQIKSQTSSNI